MDELFSLWQFVMEQLTMEDILERMTRQDLVDLGLK